MRRSGSQRAALAAVAAAVFAAAAAGCGTDEPDLVAGKELFVERCGSCHTLARAGTSGVVGPDLDEAFGPARRQGLGEGTFEGVTRDQIANPLRNGQMPADIVTGSDADDVAAYVAAVAGKPGEDEGRLAAAGVAEVSNEPIAASGGQLEIDASPTGALAFASTRATASPGPLEILSANESPIDHNIAIRDGDRLIEGDVVGTGGTSSLTADLSPGTYEFVCTVPGHEEGGMKGELTVR
ncbi:MAG: c-type cytochrome [Solirubrobacterales bacterium]|nr:c-type cytochrome [Solirubrobacterales bacterium]